MKTTRRAAALGVVVAGFVAADDKPAAKDPKADAGAKGDGDKPGAKEPKPDPVAKPPAAEEKVAAPESWPPRVGKPFPDLALPDQDGKITRLSSLKGKVLLVEPVGMGCAACQAFSGASGKKGPFKSGPVQGGLDAFESLLTKFAKVKPSDSRLVLVQILLYDMTNGAAPKPEDAKAWAAHFGFERKANRIVLAGTPAMVNQASYDMIPGFFLVDKDLVVRSDSTGHAPKEDLYKTLLPMVAKLLK